MVGMNRAGNRTNCCPACPAVCLMVEFAVIMLQYALSVCTTRLVPVWSAVPRLYCWAKAWLEPRVKCEATCELLHSHWIPGKDICNKHRLNQNDEQLLS